MAKYKNKMIIAAFICILLVGAWFASGRLPVAEQGTDQQLQTAAVSPTPEQTGEENTDVSPVPETEIPATSATPEVSQEPSPTISLSPSIQPIPETAVKQPEATKNPKQTTNPSTEKKQEPVSSESPLPTPQQNVTIDKTAYTCTLSVRCDTLLTNIDRLDKEKVELVPQDGIVFPVKTVAFYEGESVFNVLQREMKREKIHMAFRNTPIYNAAYIEAINNFYEFDCGELSGWMYKVNGWFPNYGCSRYQLKPGDVIEWVYSCDLGRDVGGNAEAGSGQAE